MKCWIYKGSGHGETYLFLPGEHETSAVPGELLARLGPLELVMELNLSPYRGLARADPVDVMEALERQGFYLQLAPPPWLPSMEQLQ